MPFAVRRDNTHRVDHGYWDITTSGVSSYLLYTSSFSRVSQTFDISYVPK